MARTVLQVAQDAAAKLGIKKPGALVSSTERTAVELAAIANEIADRIVREHDWRQLTALETYTGDDTTTGFALPTDYLRMPKDGQVWSTRWERPLVHVTLDEWLQLDVREYDLITGTYIMLNDEMQFRPALATGEQAKWYYIRSTPVKAADGSLKERFTADTDTYVLGDRLLELHVIWEWRHRKGLPYEEDMRTAELALAQEISRDKGARMLTQASRQRAYDKIAYPWRITP